MAVLNIEHSTGAVLWTKADHPIVFQCVSHRHIDGNKMRDQDCILAEFAESVQYLSAPTTQGLVQIKPPALKYIS